MKHPETVYISNQTSEGKQETRRDRPSKMNGKESTQLVEILEVCRKMLLESI